MAIDNDLPSSGNDIPNSTNTNRTKPSVRRPDRAPPSWRVGHGPAERNRHSKPRPESGLAGGRTIAARAKHRAAARPVPTVTASYVVEIAPPDAASPDIVARIRPTELLAASAAAHGLRFSDSVLDIVASLLVELAREDDGEGEESS